MTRYLSLEDSELSQEALYEAMAAEYAIDCAYFGLCWPNYCTKCGGWGQFHWTENHGPGLGESMSELCECVQERQEALLWRKCARCGEFGLDPDENCTEPCCFCGWNFDDGIPEM